MYGVCKDRRDSKGRGQESGGVARARPRSRSNSANKRIFEVSSLDFSAPAISSSYFDLQSKFYVAKFMAARDEGQELLLWVVRWELELWFSYDLQGSDERAFYEIKSEAERLLRPVTIVTATISRWEESNDAHPIVLVYLDALGDRLVNRWKGSPTTRVAGTVFDVGDFDPLVSTKTVHLNTTDDSEMSALWLLAD